MRSQGRTIVHLVLQCQIIIHAYSAHIIVLWIVELIAHHQENTSKRNIIPNLVQKYINHIVLIFEKLLIWTGRVIASAAPISLLKGVHFTPREIMDVGAESTQWISLFRDVHWSTTAPLVNSVYRLKSQHSRAYKGWIAERVFTWANKVPCRKYHNDHNNLRSHPSTTK